MMKRIVTFIVLISFLGIGFMGCTTMNNTQRGAAIGGALGAVSGAVIGNNWHGKHHDTVRNGAVIGGLIGAISGAVIGNQMDQMNQRNSYYRY